MEPKPGTYALVLQSAHSLSLEVGRWGKLSLKPGYYIYVGSAFGPGGVRARVSRHYRADKTKRWHIDFLREQTVPYCCWYSYSPDRLEHIWAQTIAWSKAVIMVEGFGCSDCQCCSHLFYTKKSPTLDLICEDTTSSHYPIMCEPFVF